MKNTGFGDLRIIGRQRIDPRSMVTAVHSQDILKKTRFYPDLSEATADLHLVFASTSKKRKNSIPIDLDKAVAKMSSFPEETRIGLLFGNERTGLTSDELRSSNFLFTIPQASVQPSYNLASAVLLTLYEIGRYGASGRSESRDIPLTRAEQEELLRLLLAKLEEKKFIHPTNKRHVTGMICNLIGRLAPTARDRNLLLALFSLAGEGEAKK